MKDPFMILANAAKMIVIYVFLEFLIIEVLLASSRFTLQTWQGINVCVGRNWSSNDSIIGDFSQRPLHPFAPIKIQSDYNQKSARAVKAA